MKGISIIICAYNSGEKLRPTLRHLAQQKRITGIEFELIIVDNNCLDNSMEIAREEWKNQGNPYLIKIIKESRAGLTYARMAGIEAAVYEYIILCDDDNWFCKDYASNVFGNFESMKEVAVIGGVGEAVSEVELPEWFHKVEGFGYAIGNEGRKTGYVDSVYGAGMSVRKSIFESVINVDDFMLTDRKGKSLASGGDTEICLLIKQAGYHIYLDETLRFKHFLNKERLTWFYYLKLRRSFGEATAVLQKKNKEYKIAQTFKNQLSILKFGIKNWMYLLMPSFYKNKACANFTQEWSRRKAILKIK